MSRRSINGAADTRWVVRSLATGMHVLTFSTSNYAAMVQFFRDFGFTITEVPRDQMVPLFESGRGVRVSRGDLEFQLEESESADARARFNLWLLDSTDEDVARLKALGYPCESQESIYGASHTFRNPDGGRFML